MRYAGMLIELIAVVWLGAEMLRLPRGTVDWGVYAYLAVQAGCVIAAFWELQRATPGDQQYLWMFWAVTVATGAARIVAGWQLGGSYPGGLHWTLRGVFLCVFLLISMPAMFRLGTVISTAWHGMVPLQLVAIFGECWVQLACGALALAGLVKVSGPARTALQFGFGALWIGLALFGFAFCCRIAGNFDRWNALNSWLPAAGAVAAFSVMALRIHALNSGMQAEIARAGVGVIAAVR